MSTTPTLRRDLAKIFLYPLLSLFLLPLLAWLFVQHAVPEIDVAILSSIERSIDQDQTLTAPQKQEEKAFFRANPPSSMCGNRRPELANYREGVCGRYSELWQFTWVGRVAAGMLAVGGLALLAALGLGAIAFRSRRAQHLSFVLGWRLMTWLSALEVIVQGVLAVWLSYWVTAFFSQSYYPKLILVAGALAAVAVFSTVVNIFKRPPVDTALDGELLLPEAAPALWAHVRALAEQLPTRAPDQIIAGIDSNFFVTEAPLTVGGQSVQGRSLYLSLPLLRVMARDEADAVLAHELAHLRGGDAASSAALGPKLSQYDYYCQMMASTGVTVPVFYLMQLYRVIFEFALKRESRAREFLADRTAAALVSARAIVQSLLKLSAYSNYRGQIEDKLFQQEQRHAGALGIASFVAEGLAPYAHSPAFQQAMASADVPHPFDSHPSLPERMANVDHVIAPQDMGAIAGSEPGASWIADIPTAPEIEQRLWADYEQKFAAAHEQDLAYRYEPANEEERAIVLKYFPPVNFPLKGGQQIQITYAGPVLPEQEETLPWDRVGKFNYVDGFGADVLRIEHPEKGWLGAKSTKVKLPGIRKQREHFKQVLGHYWMRHQYMREQQAKKA